MNRPFNITALACLLSLLLTTSSRGQLTKSYDNQTSIKVENMFSSHIKAGYHPYKVTIRNGKSRDITWTIRINHRSSYGSQHDYKFQHQITVASGAEAIEEMLVPYPPTGNASSSIYQYTDISASAPGLDNANRNNSESIDMKWPSLIISSRLADRNLSRLEAEKKKRKSRHNEHFASRFSELPTNWKGMTGVDTMLIDESTWKKLPAIQKKSAMTWVRFGGLIDFYTEQADATLGSLGLDTPDSGFADDRKGKYSLGAIEIRKWDGKDLPASALVNRYISSSQFNNLINENFRKSWGMISSFGTKNFNPTLVFILLIIFAILVGPVNLFHFAKAGQRHRLFITTPLISLAASLIIMFIILIQDGIGGSGQRTAFVDIQSQPEQRQLQITQHQLSRTGVILKSGFQNPNTPSLVPVSIPDSRWNPLSNNNSKARYQFQDDQYNGDWFRSRSEQAFHARDVIPTRSRIEIRQPAKDASPPELFSSLEFSLNQLFYVDGNGTVWKSTDSRINSGQPIPVEKSDANALSTWLNEAGKTLGSTERNRIRAMRNNKTRYFGLAEDTSNLMIATHPAIRWKDDTAIISGLAVNP